MLQRVAQTAQKAGCEKICVVVGYQKEAVISSLTAYSTDIHQISFAEQLEQMGTGHAVMMAESSFKGFTGDVFILSGDVPLLRETTLRRMYQTHSSSGAMATVLTALLDDAGKYGRIIRDDQDQICSIVEYKDASEEQRRIKEFNTGIYCFSATALFEALAQISNRNNQQEYYLTDVLQILYRNGRKVASVILDDLVEVSGVNSQEQLAELEDAYNAGIRKHWLNNGVVIHNPASVIIGEDVRIAPDTHIGANCIIEGTCHIGEGVLIGHNCLIRDSEIGKSATLDGCNVVIGAHIRSGQHLRIKEDVIATPEVPKDE